MLAPDTGGGGGGGGDAPGKAAPNWESSGAGKKEGSITSQALADFIRDNPARPESVACTAWAVQDFTAIKRAPGSERSQAFLSSILRIEPYESTEPLFRGERCKSIAAREALISRIRAEGGFEVENVASSFSKDREVALKESTGEHGLLFELRDHHGMRDFEPIVKQVAPHFAYQKEVLAPKGLKFIFLGESDAGGIPVLHLAGEAV